MSAGAEPEPGTIEIVHAAEAGPVRWRFDAEFLTSTWRCRFGDGCLGMLEQPTPELQQGCCSHGADLGSDDAGRDEAMAIAALAATLDAEQWQHRDVFDRDGIDGIFTDNRTSTAVVDGACVFLNRPGFAGGAGCALHLAAVEVGESPVDWKPTVCWQLPLNVNWSADPNDPDGEVVDVKRWGRTEWGDHGTRMAWCCTDRLGDQQRGAQLDAYEAPADGSAEIVIDSLRDELVAVAGTEVYVELRRRLGLPRRDDAAASNE